MNRIRTRWVIVVLAACGVAAAADAPTPAPTPLDVEEAYDAAKGLFDALAPQEVKDEYEFPSREQFQVFAGALQAAMDGDSMEDLAAREPEARRLLAVLRAQPEAKDYADWLEARLDELRMAQAIAHPTFATPPPTPALTPSAAPLGQDGAVPYYADWYQKLRGRPRPAAADGLMPQLRQAFASEGVPADLAWIAEVESSLNPSARNPSGARGLFQLKADTAKGLGLSTFLPDERTDPARSAHAAARLLRRLHERFGTWPLAIAAYNAGEGRVGRAVGGGRRSYADVASSLPSGTRLYVPEVCALVAVRTGHRLD